MQTHDETAAIEALAKLVTDALDASDALQLWDVSIGLDRARLAIQKLRGEAAVPLDLAGLSIALGGSDPRAGE